MKFETTGLQLHDLLPVQSSTLIHELNRTLEFYCNHCT